MKTLIIHHLESIWDDGYRKMSGVSFEELVWKFLDHLETFHYDRVILTRFESCGLEPEHEPISHYITDVFEYAYGWEAEELENYPDRFCEGGTHSEAVLIEDWMKIDGEVFISGAFDGECIEDLEIALSHLEDPFKRIEELII